MEVSAEKNIVLRLCGESLLTWELHIFERIKITSTAPRKNTACQMKCVPNEMIAAILRIETGFGSYTGTYVVPNVFYSFIVHGKRVEWATENLAACLIYAKREGIDPFSLKGSYAGAIGYPQFLPQSILVYGVDGNNDGRVDMYYPADFIPSIANFLVQHGYTKSPRHAITGYYGSSNGYPSTALQYARAIQIKINPKPHLQKKPSVRHKIKK